MKKKKQRHVRPIERQDAKRPGVSALKTASSGQGRTSLERAGRDSVFLLTMQRSLGNRAVQRLLAPRLGAGLAQRSGQRGTPAAQTEQMQGNRHVQRLVDTRQQSHGGQVVQLRAGRRGKSRRRVRLTAKQRWACKSAKKLTEYLYSLYGFRTSMKYLTTPRGWRKKYYKFYWRLHYNMVRATIKKGKYSFMATQRHLSRFKNFMSHYEARINWLRKNRGHRSAQGRNKEAKLVRYGYKFQYLRTYRAGVGRCTIRDPRGTVLFYEITNAQVEQALNWLLRQAVIKGYTLQKARSPAAKIPFSYKQVLKQARQEYRSLSRIRKRARFKDFKKMLTLARLMDLQWETNYGLGGLGRAEDKIVRSLWAFHRRGHRGWKLIKYVWHQHMVDCWKVAAYNWAMRFGTGKYKLH